MKSQGHLGPSLGFRFTICVTSLTIQYPILFLVVHLEVFFYPRLSVAAKVLTFSMTNNFQPGQYTWHNLVKFVWIISYWKLFFNLIIRLNALFRYCPWCNGYRRRKWTQRHEFKSCTRLIAFHIALIPLGKV